MLRRLNRFLELMHVTGRGEADRDSHLDTARAMLEETEDVAPIEGKLEPAFPVRPEWHAGELGSDDVRPPDLRPHFGHFATLREALRRERGIELHPSHDGKVVDGELGDTPGIQGFRLSLRSQRSGDAVLLRASSQVAEVDLRDDAEVDHLQALLNEGLLVKLCVLPRTHPDRDTVLVQDEIAFSPQYTRLGDVSALIDRTAGAAARLRVGTTWSGSRAGDKADLDTLLERLDALVAARGLPWERRGRQILVRFPGLGRRQHVRLRRLGPLYRFWAGRRGNGSGCVSPGPGTPSSTWSASASIAEGATSASWISPPRRWRQTSSRSTSTPSRGSATGWSTC